MGKLSLTIEALPVSPKLVFVDGNIRIDCGCDCTAVVSGDALVQSIAMPVAAIGWPFDSRPPETFTGVLPVRQVAPELKKSTAPPSSQSIRLS